jgi:hypothetical protein
MTRPKQSINIHLDYEDYEELKKDSRGITGAIREALRTYLSSEMVRPTVEKLERKISIMQEYINQLNANIDSLTSEKKDESPQEYTDDV